MARIFGIGLAVASLLVGSSVSAHHQTAMLGTVTISQPVMAGSQMVPPGTYEIRLTGKHMDPLPGQSENAAQEYELVAKGAVVARDFAEVFGAEERPVGTSGATSQRPRVERLKGDEYLRISTVHGGERYLIHLAIR